MLIPLPPLPSYIYFFIINNELFLYGGKSNSSYTKLNWKLWHLLYMVKTHLVCLSLEFNFFSKFSFQGITVYLKHYKKQQNKKYKKKSNIISAIKKRIQKYLRLTSSSISWKILGHQWHQPRTMCYTNSAK